jgi:hypothetical protein
MAFYRERGGHPVDQDEDIHDEEWVRRARIEQEVAELDIV